MTTLAQAYQQDPEAVGGSLAWSALVSVLPLAVVLVLLGVLRLRAQWAALSGLAAALPVVVLGFATPAGMALSAAAHGAFFGLFPILWIVVNALWVFNMTVATGHFDVLRRSFGALSVDERTQAILVAFCSGGLLEALAGFGAPVAITSVMLVALGFKPIKAAVVALVANTAPVAFGAMGVPVITLARVTGLPLDQVASMVGRQTPLLALFVPLVLVFLVDGRRGVREAWVPAVACGVVFAIGQFVTSNFVSVELTDIVASLLGAIAVVGLARVLGVGAARTAATWWRTVVELRWAILTVAAVLALAYVMNASAQTTAIGLAVAGAGAALAFLSPVLGWFGVAVTGSDTSANALFGALQVTAAQGAGLIFLQSTPVLGWMLPG
jgi:lactate permease